MTRHNLPTSLALTAAMLILSACHTTRVGTATGGPRYSDRQFFSAGGLVRLSEPAGEECAHGLRYVESERSLVDNLISFGIGLAGAGAGALVCGPGAGLNDEDLAACVSVAGSVAPFLVSTRSVEYECADAPPSQALGEAPRLRAGSQTAQPIAKQDSAELFQALTPTVPAEEGRR